MRKKYSWYYNLSIQVKMVANTGKFLRPITIIFSTLIFPSAAFSHHLCPSDRPRVGASQWAVGHFGAYVPRDNHINYPVEKYKPCAQPITTQIPEQMLQLDIGNKIINPEDQYSLVSSPKGGHFFLYKCGKVYIKSWKPGNRGRTVNEYGNSIAYARSMPGFPLPKHFDSRQFDTEKFTSINSLLMNNDQLSVIIVSKSGRPYTFEGVGAKVDKSTRPWKRNYPAFDPGKTWFQRKKCTENDNGKMTCEMTNTFWYAWKNDSVLSNAYVKTVQTIRETANCSDKATFF
jgi:hypothetical protein